MKSDRTSSGWGVWPALLCAGLLVACVTEQTTVSRPRSMGSAPHDSSSRSSNPPRTASGDDTPFELNLQPGGRSLTIDVRAAISMLGAVPYDNFSLPLVSPDGYFLATEAGVAPTWAMTLAEPDAVVPEATRVEIYQLDVRGGIPEDERRTAQRAAVVAEPALLGRGSDSRGFLVESPRLDGSRWIGLASWRTGEIEWLVQDEHVNAFATLGPGGRLAWSRRRLGERHFELVVRHNSRDWSYASDGQEWVLPHWSGRDDGLFILNLRGTRLDLAHVFASSEAAMRQSLRLTPLATGANVYIAYQTMASTVSTVGLPMPMYDQIAFVHPAETRAAVWRPLSAAGAVPVLLEEDSIAAMVDETDIAFVSTVRDLMRQSLENPKIRAKMLAGTLIARRINHPEWHSVLLAPQEGRIGLSVTRLLPPEEE